jgi:phosphoribosyl transferase-like protein/RNA binding Pelota-like protein
MKSTYDKNDVELLLKDISGLVEPLPTEEREKRIQGGTHYCEMLPVEYKPSEKYMKAYEMAMKNYGKITADATARISEKMFQEKGENLVIVSLARAGIPIGILAHRYILNKYHVNVKHYAISIIRDRGIDHNAMNYILERHQAEDIQFLDGWVGKGAIFRELEKALENYPKIDKRLAVVADPANITDLCGTHEDILIPSSCLNSTITGLISRTFFRKDIISQTDFHGAAFYGTLAKEDQSKEYLDEIEGCFDYTLEKCDMIKGIAGLQVVQKIQEVYEIDDINFVKPGIGETTRVLLRRVPWKILINEAYETADELVHIKQLAKEKGVPVEISRVSIGNYKVCGIIQKIADI